MSTAYIVTVGNELSEGRIQDTHGRYLAGELTSLGYSVEVIVAVPDRVDSICRELERGLSAGGVVVMSGGLGPTSDDLAREAVAHLTGRGLVVDQAALARLRRRLGGADAAAERQILIPEGLQPIENPVGIAPGFAGAVGVGFLVALPGPPQELTAMWPVARGHLPGGRGGSEGVRLTALMVGESSLEEALRRCRVGGTVWSTQLCEDRIGVVLRGRLADAEATARELVDRLGEYRIRSGDAGPAERLLSALGEGKKRLAVAESCTGGLICKLLTDVPGSSSAFAGGCVTYADTSKTELLGVSPAMIARHGAVSQAVVGEMSRGVRLRLGCEYAAAVSGVAGPGGGTPAKPVGTVWVCVCGQGAHSSARRFLFRGNRDGIRRKAAVAALVMAESAVASRRLPDCLPEESVEGTGAADMASASTG